MQRLPEEIVLHIFSHFGPLEIGRGLFLVCRSWNALLKDDTLWVNIFKRHIKQHFRLELIVAGERPFEAYKRLHSMNMYARYAIWADLPGEVVMALNARFSQGRWWAVNRAPQGQYFARPAIALSRASHAMKNLSKMELLTDAVLTHTLVENWDFVSMPDHPVNVQYRTAVYDACRYKLHQLYSDELVWQRLLCAVERRVAALRERVLSARGRCDPGVLLGALHDDLLPALRNVGVGSEYLRVAHAKDSVAAGLALFRDGLLLHPLVCALLVPGDEPPSAAAAAFAAEFRGAWALLPPELAQPPAGVPAVATALLAGRRNTSNVSEAAAAAPPL
jgi:hypothetical protein